MLGNEQLGSYQLTLFLADILLDYAAQSWEPALIPWGNDCTGTASIDFIGVPVDIGYAGVISPCHVQPTLVGHPYVGSSNSSQIIPVSWLERIGKK